MTFSITFYDNIKYHRMDFINRDLDFFGNGVVALADFPLTFPGTPNMTATLGQGRAWVDGYRIYNDSSPITVNFLAADPTNPRIDIIQLGHDDVNSAAKLMVKQGVASATPVEPNADPGYIKLYAINVAAGAASISASNIIDRRGLVPLNVSATQIGLGGSAGTNQNNTFNSGYTQTFNGPVVSNNTVTLADGFNSTVAQGTSPFTVNSTTQVNNLNAALVNGYSFNQSLKTTDSPTFAKVTAGTLVANVAQGTAPLTVTSTTKVSNLNVDQVDGYDFNQSLKTTDSVTFAQVTSSGKIISVKNTLDDGSGNATFAGTGSFGGAITEAGTSLASKYLGINANAVSASKLSASRTLSLTSDVTGSASFDGSANASITATLANVGTAGTYTKVTTDSKGRVTSGGALASSDVTTALGFTPAGLAANSFTGNQTAPSFISNVAQGTAPLSVVSTTKVTNLNVDKVDGYDFNQSLTTTDSPTFAGVSASTFTSSVANGTAPFTITSQTKVANLNVDMVDGYNFNQSLQTTDSPTFSGLTVNGASAFNNHLTMGATGTATSSANYNSQSIWFSRSSWNGSAAGIGTSALYVDGSGALTFNNESATPILKLTQSGALNSLKNILDDGNGNATFGNQIAANAPQGTAPFQVSSTTKVTNLNADLVDGYSFNQSLKTTDSPTFAGLTIGSSAAATQSWVESFGLGGNGIQVTDFNSISANGFYEGVNVTNGPTTATGDYYSLIHNQWDANTAFQIAVLEGNNAFYSRTKAGGTWGSWKQLATTDVAQMLKLTQDNGLALSSSATDMNNFTTTGTWYVGSAVTANLPSTVTGGYADNAFVRVSNPSANAIHQELIYYGGNLDRSVMFTRTYWKSTSTWGDWNQTAAFTDFGASLGGSGWQKLPSGMMIQWGYQGSVANGGQVNFPTSFPQSCVVVVPIAYGSTPVTLSVESNITKSNFHINSSATVSILYIAIGY